VTGPDAQVRAVLAAALMADASVQAVLGHPVRLYEARSTSAPYPHASWGRTETTSRDADGVQLIETRLSLDVWGRDEEVLEVTGAVRGALRAMDLDLPEPWTLVSLMPVYSDHFTTRIQRIRRGLIRLKAVMACDATL
jgi:hypothetical protein